MDNVTPYCGVALYVRTRTTSNEVDSCAPNSNGNDASTSIQMTDSASGPVGA